MLELGVSLKITQSFSGSQTQPASSGGAIGDIKRHLQDPFDPAAFPVGASQQQQIDEVVGKADKEAEPFGGQTVEIAPYMESVEPEMSPEVMEYMEQVEKDRLVLDKPIVHHGQTLVDSPGGSNDPQIILPLSKASVILGLEQKFDRSIRWLATWCVRIIKKFRGRVVYTNDSHTPGSDL